MLRAATIICALIACSYAQASYWKTEKSEKDPFDKSKSTFIAATIENGHALAIRCLEGTITFAVSIPSGSVDRDENLEIKIVADDKDPIESAAGVLNSNVLVSIIQFGDESTAAYLKSAKKFFLRTAVNGQSSTFGFTGGRSFDDALAKAEAACGIAQAPAPTSTPQQNDLTKYAGKDCSKERSCSAQFACLAGNNQLGDQPDSAGFVAWCKRQPGMRP